MDILDRTRIEETGIDDAPIVTDEGDERDLMTINMGPQHPSTHGVLRLIATLDGEQVVKLIPDIGYLHTGIEKTAESKTYMGALTLTDRTDYLNPLINNLGFTLAVEKLLGIQDQIPQRAQVARVILCELQRISSHLVWLGTSALDMGMSSTFLYGLNDRERILDIFEMCSGVRMMTSFIQPGGLYADLPPNFVERVRDFLGSFRKNLPDYGAMTTKNELWLERTKGVAAMTAQEALAWAVTGPMLRATGIKWDLRKAMPYIGYETYDFDVPTMRNGDVYDRFVVRMREITESVKIIEQGLERLPDGDFRIENRKIVPPPKWEVATNMEALIHHFKLYTEGFSPPPGEVYSRVESARGELAYYIVSDGSNRAYRMHIRAPSFANLQSMASTLEGKAQFADVVAAIGSIDIILGEVDR